MTRRALDRKTGKALKADGKKKQLNASLPEQLVLDFNRTAADLGRDHVLKNVLLTFLERVEPESKSVQEFRASQEGRAESKALGKLATLTNRQAAYLAGVVDEQEALQRARKHALEILAITASALRIPPKRSPIRGAQRRGRKVS